MRWSYKTVHYEMKKEGLLGSAFLDESEVELSLNEYGKAGWELVSILETHDGLIAVFKQPLSLGSRSLRLHGEEFEDRVFPLKPERSKGEIPESRVKPVIEEVDQELVPVDEYEVIEEEPEMEEKTVPSNPVHSKVSSKDVGAIRIE